MPVRCPFDFDLGLRLLSFRELHRLLRLRGARAQLRGRVISCMIPTLRIVMKSCWTLNLSAPLIGRFSRPIFPIGSGRSAAAMVRSFDAETAKSLASSCLERQRGDRWASPRVRGTSSARTVPAAAQTESNAAARAGHSDSAIPQSETSETKQPRGRLEHKRTVRFMTLTASDGRKVSRADGMRRTPRLGWIRMSAAEITGDWPVSVERDLKAQARRTQVSQ